MRSLPIDSFRGQMAIIALASISVAALAFILIRDAVSRTETKLSAEARQQCLTAVQELDRQYRERAAYVETDLSNLPFEVQDLSLRGLAATVLRTYEGVEGGFYSDAPQKLIGHASPPGIAAHELGDVELQLLKTAVGQSRRSNSAAAVEGPHESDLIVLAAQPAGAGYFAWTLKRLEGVRDPVLLQRRWWLAALVFSAVTGLAGVVSISVRLRRGVEEIKHTLERLEEDFTYRPAPQRGDFGEISAAISQMADRRMELEAGLRRHDRLAALGKVVAGVAHEIRNPLNSMRLMLELLERKARKESAPTAEVQASIEQVDRLNLILGRLLAFGRSDLEARRTQPVEPLVRQSVQMVQERSRQKNVSIRIAAEEAGATQADVDGPQIEQVLINLLLNAIQASPPQKVVDVHMYSRNGSLNIDVADRGPGIQPEIREHVFDAFFTTRHEGTGLGLSVSREIVANHGGQLDFTTGDTGTTFTVRLPLDRRGG